MKQSNANISSLPILIFCMQKDQEEGNALLLSPLRGEAVLLRRQLSFPVRRFKDADLRHVHELMGKSGTDRFVALVRLHSAIARKQRQDIESAREQLCSAVSHEYKVAQRAERWSKEFGTFKQRKKRASIYPKGSLEDEVYQMTHVGDLTDEYEALTTRYRTEDPVRLFAVEMSAALKDHVHLVLWLSGTRATPALLCDDPVPAAYAYALFGRRWRVCPYSACGKWFIVTKTKQDYCCPKHREAHRVARWRKRHKTEPKSR
jgi:hypothetical protein